MLITLVIFALIWILTTTAKIPNNTKENHHVY